MLINKQKSGCFLYACIQYIVKILFCFCVTPTSLIAQDTVQLETVEVSASVKKIYGVPSLKSIEIDSAFLRINRTKSIGEILKNNSSVFIKDYGPSGIQTPTFRGMSASHTKIYLNGLDVSPSSLGQSDLSILPSFLFNGVSLNYGNTSFTEGPGAIGGGVMLKTNPVSLGKSGNLGVSYGSFNAYSINGEYSFRNYKWESVTRFIYKEVENNFKFRNVAKSGYPIQTQENSKTKQQGILQTISFSPIYKSHFKLVLLGTLTNRELPGLMTSQNISQQNQEDKLISAQFNWKRYLDKGFSNMTLGYSWSVLNYLDPASNINSTTLNQKYQFREDFVCKLTNKWSLKSMALIDYSTAYNVKYAQTESQLQSSVLIGLKGDLSEKWAAGLYVQPTVNGANFEVLPMASLAFMPLGKDHLILGVNASQNVHFPTLNDLYWVPGGNPSLQPEKATKSEFNVHWHNNDLNKVNWEINAATFYGLVDNWVLWQPSGKGYWEAQNIKTVEHSGAEISMLLSKKWKSLLVEFQTNYQYVKAINKGVSNESLNKQLIYTPENMFNWNLKAHYNNLWINLNYVFTDIRYITTSNSSYLPEFDLMNLSIGKTFKTKSKQKLLVQIDVNNIFGKEYMSVAYRAMPRTNFELSVRYHLKNSL